MTKKTAPMTKADYELLSEFRYQLRRFMRFSEEAVQSEGLTPLQYQLLLQLKGFPGREWATIGELAERLQARHHGVVALVTRCENTGLVQRVTGSADRRQVEVHLTKKGNQCIARLAGLHRTELRSLSDVFSVENIGAFNDGSVP
ncbi:winged helix-turn-helix transcriptional regulator [Azohydromonas sp. G-1-1-14]|uniref:Winged helix-turn-helix transcriptional regulator n=2 Tax=Azohydromonas caseinilytica TaxID=2728836 RepID=A0A848FL73_9BURK|nr:MarR family winged helix-turn-helix transcriptional regulator [Azohydromonas caseinilytica]NML18551.1 winged helix-turn-helix transcriptional regulator [Azohydromonas caseinilytica]